MKTCWCCNGKGFVTQPACSLCQAGTDHHQCLRDGEPKKMTCHACDKKLEIKK